jgi:hypothetical protein
MSNLTKTNSSQIQQSQPKGIEVNAKVGSVKASARLEKDNFKAYVADDNGNGVGIFS